MTITTETNSYDWTMDEFIEGNFTKFITSSKFRKANNIEQTKEPYTKTVGEYTATFYNMELKDCPADVMSHYTYAFITQGESKEFWFFTLKYQDGAQVDLEPIVDSFQKIRVRGVGVYSKTSVSYTHLIAAELARRLSEAFTDLTVVQAVEQCPYRTLSQ